MFRDLQWKCINDDLSPDEMRTFLDYIKSDPSAEFREDRIRKLERSIRKNEQKLLAESAERHKSLNAAIEYKKLADEWESLGAYWKPLGTVISKWYYKDACFFTWFSGVDAIAHLKSAKLADKGLRRLIEEDANDE